MPTARGARRHVVGILVVDFVIALHDRAGSASNVGCANVSAALLVHASRTRERVGIVPRLGALTRVVGHQHAPDAVNVNRVLTQTPLRALLHRAHVLAENTCHDRSGATRKSCSGAAKHAVGIRGQWHGNGLPRTAQHGAAPDAAAARDLDNDCRSGLSST